MAAGATYEPIATQTLASAGTITFSSIAASWTDLRLVVVSADPSGSNGVYLRFNGDSASNYSQTRLTGDGTTAGSTAQRNQTEMYVAPNNTTLGLATADIFSYAGSTYKTVLNTGSNDLNGSGYVQRVVGLWRSTAAITSIYVSSGLANFAIGTTATLYGIKAA